MLDAVWVFLKDPANRAVLGWVGGGVVITITGVWAVIKFIGNKERGPSVKASSGGVAAGRDMIGNKIDTGGSRPGNS